MILKDMRRSYPNRNFSLLLYQGKYMCVTRGICSILPLLSHTRNGKENKIFKCEEDPLLSRCYEKIHAPRAAPRPPARMPGRNRTERKDGDDEAPHTTRR